MATMFVIKVNIFVLIKWSYVDLVIHLEWLSYFEHKVQSLLNTCLLYIHSWNPPNHIPLRNRCLIKLSNQIRHIYLKLERKSRWGYYVL